MTDVFSQVYQFLAGASSSQTLFIFSTSIFNVNVPIDIFYFLTLRVTWRSPPEWIRHGAPPAVIITIPFALVM